MITRRVNLVIFAALLLFSAGCATAPRHGTATGALSAQTVNIDGKSYIPLTLIAGYYQARCEWDPVARRADLIKENKTFVFYVGMDYAAINGRPEKLTSPAVFYEGSVAIPADFAIEEISKVLSPPRITGPRPPVTQKYLVRKVVIDAGHGGNDPGAIGRTGLKEKDLVLDVAKRLKEQLNENGVEVVMTRDRDKFIPLEKRSQIANESGVDFFVSIHANSAKL